ncbi:uncharacterized protein LOC116843539 [Odontomachus brunneus]|uniref:uncharacterized protein LOC116843539 n=1 Tax=Odontomachus brunneus TaxID=486640 RepID=UPI0013F296DD|nr:uncharacterized protein LOC116843539 [Odontomachus brunneus]
MRNNKIMARKSTINRIVRYLLILFGIWPDVSCMMFCRVFWSISLAILVVCHYQYLLTHLDSNDLSDLMDCFSAFVGYIKLIFKFIVFWWNERVFNQMLKIMAEDWKDCANSDIEMCKTASKAKISDYIANAIITLHTVAVLFYDIVIILTDVDIADSTIEIPHIYSMEIPFDITSQVMYKLLLIMELIHLIMSSWGMGVINSLLLTLTLHVGDQIDILLYWLELVSVNSADKYRSHMMEKIIRKHQKIIYFTENIEYLYTFIALMQFVTNVMMICVLGYLIITAFDNPDAMDKIVRSLSFYSVTNLEAFMFCYAGEYLINKSKAIGHAVYDCAWYDMEPKHSRILLFIILRAQKQFTLTIGKLMDLSLQRFAYIMNSAGSYISVLLAMQKKHPLGFLLGHPLVFPSVHKIDELRLRCTWHVFYSTIYVYLDVLTMHPRVRVLMRNNKVTARKSTINRMVRYLLILFGIWPDVSCMMFCRIFWGISFAIVVVCQYRYLLTHLYSNDLSDLMDCFSTFVGYIKLTFKFIVFWWNERIFNQMLKIMAEDWKNCANNDIEMCKAASKAKISDYIANAIITLHIVSVIFYGMDIILTEVDITDPTIEIPHVFKMEFPFNITSQVMYKLTLIIELIQVILSSCGMGVINSLLLTLAFDNPDAMEKIVRSLSLYSVTNLEAFMFCYAGEYLINKSKAIGHAAYDCAWYDMEPKHSRILLFIILRAQKQLTLTIGKLMDLSLQRFAYVSVTHI